MKKQRLLLFSLLLIAFSTFFISCKKHSSPSVQCRIIDIKTNDSLLPEIQLDYNSNKKLSVITYRSKSNYSRRILNYNTNFISVTLVDSSGKAYELDTVNLNKDGLASSIVYYVPANGLFSYDSMTYDSKGQLIRWAETSAGSTDIVTYTWDNGDLVTSTSRGTTTTIQYYNDKTATDGDYLRIIYLTEWGIPLYKSKHLFKGSGGSVYSYTFDSGGKITSVLLNGVVVYSYTYACD